MEQAMAAIRQGGDRHGGLPVFHSQYDYATQLRSHHQSGQGWMPNLGHQLPPSSSSYPSMQPAWGALGQSEPTPRPLSQQRPHQVATGAHKTSPHSSKGSIFDDESDDNFKVSLPTSNSAHPASWKAARVHALC